MIANLFCRPIEKALNKAIATHPDSLVRLKELHGTTFKIKLTDLNLALLLEAYDDRLLCRMDDDTASHVTVTGTTLSFLQSAWAGGDASAAKRYALHMHGDTHTAQAWQALFAKLDIDWQALLAPIVGENPAFHVIKAAGKIRKHAKKTADSLMRDTAEYVLHEKPCLATEQSIKQFARDVADTRDATDRLQARLDRLERQQS